jgi:RNA polymerase sigma factor (sigma-70 family)
MPVGEAASQFSDGSRPDLVRLYLDQAAKEPLLAKEDEVHLAQAIEAGRLATASLTQPDLIITLPPERRGELEVQQQAGGAAHDRFIRANLRLVASIARSYRTEGIDYLDVIQEGNLGLMHAVDKFDWRRGFKFSTYATWWIRQAIGRGVPDQVRGIRLPTHMDEQLRKVNTARGSLLQSLSRSPTTEEIAVQANLPLEQTEKILEASRRTTTISLNTMATADTPLEDFIADSVDTEDEAVRTVAASEVVQAIDALLPNERERRVIHLRFGLDGHEPLTLNEVGNMMGVTRERIRQIEKLALEKLRVMQGDFDS